MTRRTRPRVVLVDDESRESFRELAGALRSRGLTVLRAVPPGSAPESRGGRLANRIVYGPSLQLVAAIEADSPHAAAHRARLLAPPTVDLHAPEQVVAELVGTPEWRSAGHLRKVRPELDEALLFDKLALTQFAERVGVHVPETWTTPTADVFPVVVKGRQGFGGRNVRLVRDADELAAAWAELTAEDPDFAFVQSFHPGLVTTTGGVASRGRLLVCGAWKVFPDPEEPLGPPMRIETTDDPASLEETRRLIEALGYTGLFNLNLVHDGSGRPLFIDLNCRVFGSWQAAQEAGVDLAGGYAALHTGRAVSTPAAVGPGRGYDVVRLRTVRGESLREVAAAAATTSATVWRRRRALGWRWAASTQLRLTAAAARAALTAARGG